MFTRIPNLQNAPSREFHPTTLFKVAGFAHPDAFPAPPVVYCVHLSVFSLESSLCNWCLVVSDLNGKARENSDKIRNNLIFPRLLRLARRMRNSPCIVNLEYPIRISGLVWVRLIAGGARRRLTNGRACTVLS